MKFQEPTEETKFLFGYDVIVTREPLRQGLMESRPHTARAVLMCNEETCGFPIRHDFLGRRLVRHRKSNMIVHDELVYSCSRCKCERVWGTEEIKDGISVQEIQ
jgi:hypothetical protein